MGEMTIESASRKTAAPRWAAQGRSAPRHGFLQLVVVFFFSNQISGSTMMRTLVETGAELVMVMSIALLE